MDNTKKPKLSFAPMEGVAGYVYRNVFHTCFGGIDSYYAPFIGTSPVGITKMKEFKDILPENNQGITLIPQLLSCRAEDFLLAAGQIKALGYKHINLNAGCPSGTVTAKGKGAGLLKEPEKLREFLETILEGCEKLELKLSVKTRIGYASTQEWEKLLEVYRSFPLEELIIHPRTREDYYKNPVHRECFQKACENLSFPLCYNGDVFTSGDYEKVIGEFRKINSVMLGRGVLKNPLLAEEIRMNENTPDKRQKDETGRYERLFAFQEQLLEAYGSKIPDEKNQVFKMIEVWNYMMDSFSDIKEVKKAAKKIRKAGNLKEYNKAIDELKAMAG